jgi:octaprenyl-diphosphate synthase
MGKISSIREPVAAELKIFDEEFAKTMKTDVPLLNIITTFLLRRKGKQVRPLLVFLSAKMIGEINKSTYTAASMIELLHTATLVHDDVVDESYERRGFFSINALWKSKLSVLLGDYLLAKGLLISVENKEYDVLEIVSNAVREMSEGELLQIQKSRKLDITEEEYFTIIRKKTAVLFSACTSSGARSVTRDQSVINKMRDFGIKLGMAFQIKDDLFDYENTAFTGKPKGNDIQEKKLTLPLISALVNASIIEKKEIIRLINKKSSDRKTYNRVFEFVHQHNGVESAQNKMRQFRDEAIEILFTFPKNNYRNSIEDLVEFIIERKN